MSSVQSRTSSTLRGTYSESSAHAVRRISIFGTASSQFDLLFNADSFRLSVWISFSDVVIPHVARHNDDMVEPLSKWPCIMPIFCEGLACITCCSSSIRSIAGSCLPHRRYVAACGCANSSASSSFGAHSIFEHDATTAGTADPAGHDTGAGGPPTRSRHESSFVGQAHVQSLCHCASERAAICDMQ